MLNLITATLLSACFGLIVRYAQGRRCNMWAVGATNYVVASLFNLGLQAVREGSVAPAAPTLLLGMLGGASYVAAYFTLFKLMALRGVAVSTAVSRLAVLFPVVASVVVWGELPTEPQAVGVALALVSLPLLGIQRRAAGESIGRQALQFLALLFLLNGVNLLVLPAFKRAAVPGQDALFLAILFGTAALIGLAVWYPRRAHTCAADLLPGAALGMVNALTNLAMVAAVRDLPGFLVFPFHSAVGLVLSTAAARLFWDERITRMETAGIAVALGAAVFINL